MKAWAWCNACIHGDAAALRSVHAVLTLFWAAAIIPTVLFWADSILWVGLMSCWANLAGHWSSWQASRVEVKQDRQDKPKRNTRPKRTATGGKRTVITRLAIVLALALTLTATTQADAAPVGHMDPPPPAWTCWYCGPLGYYSPSYPAPVLTAAYAYTVPATVRVYPIATYAVDTTYYVRSALTPLVYCGWPYC